MLRRNEKICNNYYLFYIAMLLLCIMNSCLNSSDSFRGSFLFYYSENYPVLLYWQHVIRRKFLLKPIQVYEVSFFLCQLYREFNREAKRII